MRRKRNIILWLFNLLALGLAVWLIYLVWRDAEATIKMHQESYLIARAKADLINWRAALEASAPERARLTSVFINRGSLISFIEELETVARESEVELVLGEPLIETTVLKLTLQVNGSFPGIYNLLRRFENLPYELVFDGIDLTAGAGWNGRLSITLASFNDDYVKN